MAPKSSEKAKKETPNKAGAAEGEKKSPAAAAKTRAASPNKLEKSPAKKAKAEEVGRRGTGAYLAAGGLFSSYG